MAIDGLGAIQNVTGGGSEESLEEMAAGIDEVIEGLSEISSKSDGFDEMSEDMKELVKMTAELVDNSQPKDEEPFQDVMDQFFGESAESKRGQRGKGKLVDKPDHIMDLPSCYSLPSILVWSKLDSIEKKLEKYFDGKTKKGGGIGDVFSGLAEGAGGLLLLALALLVFAGALVVFGIVDWNSALLGMLSFTLFVLGSILLAKLVRKNLDDFALLALGSMILAVGLLAFTFALKVAGSMTLGQVLLGIVVVGLFLLFTLAVSILSTVVNTNVTNFLIMAVGATAMSLSLLVFSLAFKVAGSITIPQIIQGFLVTALFMLFTIAVIALSVVVTSAIPSFIALAGGSIVLSVGLVAFSLALLVASYVGQKLLTDPAAMQAAGLILLVFLGFMALGAIISLVSPMLGAFAVASILLSVGLVAFSLAVLLAVSVLKPEMIVQVAAMLPNVTTVFLLMAVAGIAALIAVAPIAGFTVASVLMLVGMAAFLGAVALMSVVGKVLATIDVLGFLGTTAAIFGSLALVGLLSLVAMVPLAMFVAASALTLVGMAAFLGTVALMGVVDKAMQQNDVLAFLGRSSLVFVSMIALGTIATVAIVFVSMFTAASLALLVGMAAFLGTVAAMRKSWEVMEEVPLGSLLVNIAKLFALVIPLGALATLSMVPIVLFSTAATLLGSGMKSMEATTSAMKKIHEAMSTLVDEDGNVPSVRSISAVFEAAGDIKIGVGNMLKIMALSSAASTLAESFRNSLVIFDAARSISDHVVDLRSRGIEFSELMEPFKVIFVAVAEAAEGFRGMSKRAAEAMAIAVVPISEAIDNLAHTITYLADFATSPDYLQKMDFAKLAFGKMLTDFFGAGAAEPAPSTVLGMLYALKKMPKGAAEAAAALVPLTDAIYKIAQTITECAEMPDPSQSIRKLDQVIDFCMALNNFASKFKADAPGFLGAFTTSSSESMKVAKDSIDGMLPVIDSVRALSSNIGGIQDPSGHVVVIDGMIAFCLKMNEFSANFRGEGSFVRSSAEQNGAAKVAIDTMGPVIDSMKNLVSNIGEVEDTSASQSKILSIMAFNEKLNDFVSIFKPGGLFSRSSTEQNQIAKASIDSMVPVIDSMKTLSARINTVEEVGLSLQSLKNVFDLAAPADLVTKSDNFLNFTKKLKQANDAMPSSNKLKTFFDDMTKALTTGDFSKLNTVATGMQSIATSIGNVNTQLTRLRNDNSETMDKVSKMGSSGGGVRGIVASIGGALGGLTGGSSGEGANNEVLIKILEAAMQIADNTTPAEERTMFAIKR